MAGESIASRWTDQKKQAIRDSRVKGTRALVESLVRMKNLPKVLISASAIGYYGNHGAEVIKEDGAAGQDFLADVCRQWEAAHSLQACPTFPDRTEVRLKRLTLQ